MSIPPRPLIYAHRGASADHEENTFAAFAGAREQLADWVELDVHLTADSQLAIVHDPHYRDGRAVAAVAAAQRPGTVPLLEEALDSCAGMGVNIEIKIPEPGTDSAARVAELVVAVVVDRRERGVDQQICVSCFDEATLVRVRSFDEAVPTAQLIFDLSADNQVIERAAERGAVGINPWDPFVDAELIERCRSLGLAVTPWTVDSRDRIVELAALGVDGIITNTPALARGYLG